jgi:hypothetical protein
LEEVAMKRIVILSIFSLLMSGLAIADEPADIAKRYADLVGQKKYAEAVKLVRPVKGRNDLQNLTQLGQLHFTPTGSGITKVEIGKVLYVKATDKQAVVIFQKKMILEQKIAEKMKTKWEAERDEDFPKDQVAAARKVIRLDGVNLMVFFPVYLDRDLKTRSIVDKKSDEFIETKKEYGPWMINLKGESFSLKGFRGDIKKVFGANILRYGGEDSGEPGCYDKRGKEGSCFIGEDEPVRKAKGGCDLVESGEPCPEDSGCSFLGGDEPVPCAKGHKECFTIDGALCTIKG